MISIKFSDFLKQNYDDVGYRLYFIKDDTTRALYIGITSETIWFRWFGSSTSHTTLTTNGTLLGSSHIGNVVVDNLPGSWNWTIELWTKEDCMAELDIDSNDNKNVSIDNLEAQFIAKFNPLYNILHGGGYHEDPSARKRLDEEYKRIFG